MSSSLINDKIAKFYCKNITKDHKNGEKFINGNITLNFKQICAVLLEENKDLTFESFKYEDYLICYNNLQPLFYQSLISIKKLKVEKLKLDWLGSNSKSLQQLLQNYNFEDDHIGNVEKTLLLTAMLEYALGNVYYTMTKNRSPPHLLRDLLKTAELRDFYGLEIIAFLQIILGTPNSINLRNIVWHGFPRPYEMPPYFGSTLLLTIHTLGYVLEEKNMILNCRTQIKDFTKLLAPILPTDYFCLHELKNFPVLLDEVTILPQDYKIYWLRLFQYLENARYWNFVYLILPQIELILRLKYAKVNQFDVSAKLEEYYITMDTIFEPKVPYTNGMRVNKLLEGDKSLFEGTSKLMYDLFIAPNGVRLRDKVSHGEVEHTALENYQICHVLWFLGLNLLFEEKSEFSLDHYETKYHLNARVKTAIKEAENALNSCVKECEVRITEKSEKVIFQDFVKIFKRPKKEAVFMLLLLKIAELTTKTCQNYEESIISRRTLLNQYELHSKRRRTLANLQEALPTICDCLQNILQCLWEIIKKFHQYDEGHELEFCEELLRFLKRTLKISENFVKFSHKDSNEWIKVIELCKTFYEIYEKLFLNCNFGKIESMSNYI